MHLFDTIKYNCKTHPNDVIYNREDPEYNVYFENYSDDAKYDTLRDLVEDQGCDWKWYCEYHDLNVNDEKWGRHN